MVNLDNIRENKEHLDDEVMKLTNEDLNYLISLLEEKDDNLRYPAFLAIQKRSELTQDIYPYWDILVKKVNSDNSYQRSIGLMLMAENVKWDHEKKFDAFINTYLVHCTDEKFVTSRQTIQGILRWLNYKPEYFEHIINRLTAIDLTTFKDTQRKLILLDIISILQEILIWDNNSHIKAYLQTAIATNLLDKKTVKTLETLINR